MIDTGKVKDRRALAFSNSAQLIADVDGLVAAERAGTLRKTGNWTLGQALGHLAWWVNVPFEGYPADMKPPWIIKMVIRLQKKKYMQQLPAGVKIPNVEGGTKGIDVVSTEEGYGRLKRAWQRLDAGPPGIDNVIFGPLSHEEWKGLNLRHAELHLSFFAPR
jgi:hypothetical protein